MGFGERFSEEMKSRNFSVYGQWTGILCFILCLAVGIANIFHFDIIIVWSALCFVSSIVILFLEVPFLLRICPTSAVFDNFIRKFQSNYMRAGIYLLMSLAQWLSLVRYATSLIAAAVLLLLASIFYALAGLKHQQFQGSKMLGGAGVAQMII